MKEKSAPALPDTINIFLTAKCNFGCKHCYATFNDIRGTAPGFMAPELVKEILVRISHEPLPPGIPTRKVTFVGGEPTLCKDLVRFVATAKDLGLATAIVTNGSRITPTYLDQFAGALDWMGFSIDSLCFSARADLLHGDRDTALARRYADGQDQGRRRICS